MKYLHRADDLFGESFIGDLVLDEIKCYYQLQNPGNSFLRTTELTCLFILATLLSLSLISI